MPGPLNRLVHTTLSITPALGAFIGPKQYNAMVGLMASTVWSKALPTLQEWGSAVGATTHLACTPFRQDAGYLQTTRAWLKHTSLRFEPQLTMHHRFHSLTCFVESTPQVVSDYSLSFGASVTLVWLDGTVPYQLKPCASLAVSFPSWGGDTTSPLKKKNGGMLGHYRIFLAFPFLMLRCEYQGEYSPFSPLCCCSMLLLLV